MFVIFDGNDKRAESGHVMSILLSAGTHGTHQCVVCSKRGLFPRWYLVNYYHLEGRRWVCSDCIRTHPEFEPFLLGLMA